VKHRWIIVALALVAASAFAVAAIAGRWWSIGDVAEIGPFRSLRCFGEGGECEAAGLNWIGGSERWMRTGMGAWAGCLISTFVLCVTAAAVAAKRIPKLAAKTSLVSVATAALAGTAFIVQFPGVEGAKIDRGIYLFAIGIVLGAIAAISVLRARPEPQPQA
jgi:hypothetical protein